MPNEATFGQLPDFVVLNRLSTSRIPPFPLVHCDCHVFDAGP